MISSVSGNTIDLRLRQGTGTVDFTPSTEIIETTPAQLSDVTPGSCVDVRPAPQSAPGAITAQSVTVSPAIDGTCPPPPPDPAGTAPSAPSTGAPEGNPGVNGKVDAGSGNTITVASTEANGTTTQTKVTVADTTTYSKEAPTDAQALTSGTCMSAEGTKNTTGVLQATMIDLQPCPPLGRPHHRFPHIPWPHHHRA